MSLKQAVGNLQIILKTLQERFNPEELEMHEIGFKGAFLNDSLSLSAVLPLGWSDKQVIKVSVIQDLPVGLTEMLQKHLSMV